MSGRFIDWCAVNYPTPADALAAFFEDAAAAAASVGATLDALPELDKRRHDLPNLKGQKDKRQFYRASIETDPDGTVWPTVTFKSYKQGGASAYWKPRNLAWEAFQANRGTVAANNNTRQDYAAAAKAYAAAAKARAAEQEEQQAKGRDAAAAVAVAAWEAADACEAHPYLTRKGVGAYGLRIARQDHRARLWNDQAGEWQDVLAVRGGELLIPMHDQGCRLVNVQRIDSNGRKRFIMGGHAHGCHHRIEGATSGARTVLVEGYATGATWHEATGDCVVLAFSAGALPVVAAYAGANLVAADNDEKHAGEDAAKAANLPYHMPPTVGMDWNDYAAAHGLDGLRGAVANDNVPAFTRPYTLPTVELKGREQTWWNKLGSAETPEDAAALAWAIARRISVRVPVLMTLDDLAEHLRQGAPTGMMNPATVEAIRAAIGRIMEWRKARALSGVTITPDALKRHNVETVAELTALQDDEYSGVILLNTPMASGKTRRVGKPFAAWARQQSDARPGLARFLATCHRQSLVDELKGVLGDHVWHYQDVEAEFACHFDALAACLPSIVKDSLAPIINRTRFMFVDEIDQTLRSIGSEVSVGDRKTWPEVFAQLRKLVADAECIIGADAGMSDRTLAFLESCRPAGEQFRIIQQPRRDHGLAVSYGFGPDALATAYGEAMARLIQGEKLWIGCGEKSRAIEAARVLASTGARVLLLHGDNKENAEQAEFWRDPEAVSRQYDCVVHNSVISSGMSIEHEETGAYFTHGMMLASGATITPADAIQMLRRVRYLRTWTVAITPNNAKDIDNADAILAGMEAAAAVEGMTVAAATDYDAFRAEVKGGDARQRADFAAGLWWALESQGFAVERMAVQGDDDMAATIKATRAAIRDEERAAILSAPDLTDEAAQRLRDKPNRTEAEKFALLRHTIRRAMGHDVDDTTVDAWNNGRGPRQLDRWSAATMRLADRHDSKAPHLTLHRFSKARALAYAWLWDGIDLAAGLRVSDVADRIVRRVIERREMLAFLGIVPAKWARSVGTKRDGTPKPFPMPAYPVREVGKILERMGLALKRREGTATHTCPDIPLEDITPCVGKSGRQTFHEITAESWQHVEKWAALRNAAQAPVEVEAAPLAANDNVRWHDYRRMMLAKAPAMTRDQAAADFFTRLDGRPPTRGARVTAWWVREVLAERLRA